MDKLLEPCITLAQSAGDAIMAIYKKDDIGQQEKSDNTPVTKADLAANDVLVAGLKALAPDIPIMSEETPIQHWKTGSTGNAIGCLIRWMAPVNLY